MFRNPYITTLGYEALANEVSKIKLLAADITEQIRENRTTEIGDESDNVEMIRLVLEREKLSDHYNKLENYLATCNVIDLTTLPNDTNTVRFGSTVKVLDMDTSKVYTYQLLGETESNLKEGKISYTSPIGKALLNERLGQIITFETPNGDRELEILEIFRK